MPAVFTVAFWYFQTPDARDLSWWLDRVAGATGLNREVVWITVIALNLAFLVWLLYKLLFRGKSWSIPAALRGRGDDIRARMDEADRAHGEAREKLQRIEARIAALPAELAGIRREAEAEAEAEYQQIVQDHRADAERLAQNARREIEAAVKTAQKELKRFAAALALDLAEKQARERMTPELDRRLVREATDSLN